MPLKKYENLSEIQQRKENYFGLIRMALGEIDYKLIEGDKFNLAEINSLEDLETNVSVSYTHLTLPTNREV